MSPRRQPTFDDFDREVRHTAHSESIRELSELRLMPLLDHGAVGELAQSYAVYSCHEEVSEQ